MENGGATPSGRGRRQPWIKVLGVPALGLPALGLPALGMPAPGMPALAVPAIAAIVALLAFAPSLHNGFVWDDRLLILGNPAIAAPGAGWKAFGRDYWYGVPAATGDYYRPLAVMSFAFDHGVHGISPHGFHATNLLLHAAVALLLALWLLEQGMPATAATLAAALFAAHPALAENVAWVSGRTDILATLFVLCMLLADGRRSRSEAEHAPGPAAARWRAVAAVACAAALFTKETAVVAPVLAVLADVHGGRKLGPALRRRVELWLVLLVYLAARYHVLGMPEPVHAFAAGGMSPAGGANAAGGVSATGGATAAAGGLSATVRGAGLLHLPGILLAPWTTRLLYGAGLQARTLAMGAVAGALLLGGLGFEAWRAGRRGPKRAGRQGPESAGPTSALARLLRLLTGLGACSLLPPTAAAVYLSGLADRLVYLPAAFLIPAVVAAVWRHVPAGGLDRIPVRAAAAATAAVVLLAFFSAAWTRSGIWHDERAFFTRAAREPDASAPAYYNLAVALHSEGRLAECDAALDQALARARLADALYLRGLLAYETGCDDLAVAAYREALLRNSTHADAGNNLAALLFDRGEFDAAESVYREMAGRAEPPARRPAFVAALGKLQTARGDAGFAPHRGSDCASPGAMRQIMQDARALNRRGLELLRWRQLEAARIVLAAALLQDPGLEDARLNLAQYHMLVAELGRARELVLDVLRRDPGNSHAARLLSEIARREASPPP